MEGQWFPKQPIQFIGGPSKTGITVAFVTSTSNGLNGGSGPNSKNITMPTVLDNDFALLFVGAFDSSGETPAASITAGGVWSTIASVGSSIGTLYCFIKKLTAAESAGTVTVSWGTAEADSHVLLLTIWRPSVNSTATNNTWTTQMTSGNPTLQTVDADTATPPLIVFGAAWAEGGTAAFSTASPSFDSTIAGTTNQLLVGYKIYNNGPADHSIDTNDLGSSNGLISGYVRFSV